MCNRFDLGFTAAQATCSKGVSVGGVAREAALLRKVATNKSTAVLRGKLAVPVGCMCGFGRGMFKQHAVTAVSFAAALINCMCIIPQTNSPSLWSCYCTSAANVAEAAAAAGVHLAHNGPGQAAVVGQVTPVDSVYLARRDFSKLDSAFSTAGPALTPAQSFTSALASSPGTSPRMSNKGLAKYAHSLYLAGLRGMLAEMRGVRPHGTPYGHTQQLTAWFNPGQARSKVSGGALLRFDAVDWAKQGFVC